MKKQITLLAAGAMLALAACNGADHGAGTMTQAQQDSAVNARAAEQQARMQRNNDSLVNVEAQHKADSIMNATKMASKEGKVAGKAVTKTVKHTTGKTTTEMSDQDRKFQQMGGNTGNATQTQSNTNISNQKKQEQDDKFKQMGGH